MNEANKLYSYMYFRNKIALTCLYRWDEQKLDGEG